MLLCVVFLGFRVIGDPVRIVLGWEASELRVQQLRKNLQLDDPLYVQFGRFAGSVVRGDFGDSFWQRRPALPLVLDRYHLAAS